MKKVKQFIIIHFPENKKKWKLYFFYSLPIILTGIFFSLNNFVDNFMVTTIPKGVDSLSYANAWTGIVSALLAGVMIITSVFIGQYFGTFNYHKIRQVTRIRVIFIFSFTIFFAIFSWVIPEKMIKVFYTDENINELTLKQSVEYLRLIVITWIIYIWTAPMSSLLTETGYGKEAFISSIGSLFLNIVLNILFIYILDLGVKGAAYASIAARIFGIFGDTFFVYLKIRKCLISPFSIFRIKKDVWKKILVRTHSAAILSINIILIIIRDRFYNLMYPEGSIGSSEYKIGAASILGLTIAISTVFNQIGGVLGANVAIFVSSYLGKKEFETAKKQANELKGFHFVLSVFFGAVLALFALVIPHITYFADKIPQNGKQLYLYELQQTVLVIAFFNPIWIWYGTSARLISSGGRTNIVPIIDFILEVSSILWLVILTYVVKPKEHGITLFQTYWIFFTIDILKFFVYEITYIITDWARHIDDEKSRFKLWEKNVS
ncbi:MATE family efflux transporter [[Mycoplasma] collis]|uniref:MATE family efflux transporter n=1 Tax=[Mycoplasma] collis TaxID=2127 RepID=UPI00051AB6B7|nr:MATE family efflux transporter [[Mycoplasma] collis]